MTFEGLIIASSKVILFPVFIGIISTICYVLIFDKLLAKIILPWYFNKKYKSTLIDGFWKGKTGCFIFDITIRQSGDKVEGDILAKSFTIKDGKEDIFESNNYIFTGEVRDGFVRMVYREKNRSSFGFGCFIFQIAGGGKTLNGSVIFINEGDEAYTISTTEKIKLERS